MADQPANNSDRIIRRRSLARSIVHTADLPQDLANLLSNGGLDRLTFSANPLQVKDRCIAARFDHPAGRLLIKRHTWGDLARTFRSFWRASVAKGCWQRGRKLAALGIPTPRPRAYVDERFGILGMRSYLLTDFIDGKSLYDVIHGDDLPQKEIGRLADEVVAIWSKLAASRSSHNDMKPENFIVGPSGDVWLIDLERVRFHRGSSRMKRRQADDVRTFLNPRAWRNRLAEHSVFLSRFLETPHAPWLREQLGDLLAADREEIATTEESRLSVLILCDDSKFEREAVVRSLESVRQLADEIVVIAAGDDFPAGQLSGPKSELKRFAVHTPALQSREGACLARHPWVLALRGGETVSPLLAIDIQELLVEPTSCDAFRIPIENQAWGERIDSCHARSVPPIRLLNQCRCSYSVVGGALAVSVDPEQVGELGGTIEHSILSSVEHFLADLNHASTSAAEIRFEQGQTPSPARGIWSACKQFVHFYVRQGRYQRGWTGLQVSLLESLGVWLQEVKLWQRTHEFRNTRSAESASDDSHLIPTLPVPSPSPSAGRTPHAKAA